MWYVWGDDALDSPGGNVGEFWLLRGGKTLANEVMGHSTCGTIGRGLLGAL